MTLTRITSDGITDGAIVNADINASAAIAKTKLAALDIVNADVNASAAIAGTKISPNFGSQNITTTGSTSSAAITATGLLKISNVFPRLLFEDTNNNDDFSIYNANGTFRINDDTDNAPRLDIASDGTVDIFGNLDVGAGIDVTGAITSTGNLTITNTQPKIFLTDSNNSSDFSIQNENGNFNIYDESNSVSRVRIIADGRVGIGTTSPQQELHVVGDSDACVRLTCTDGGAASFQLGDASDTVIGGITLDSSDNSIQLRGNNNTERMRIDSSGRALFSGGLGFGNLPFGGNPSNAAIQIRCNSKYNGIAFGENAVSGCIGMGGADTTTAMVFVANAHPANLGGGVHDTFEWHSGTSGGGGPGKYMTLDTSGDLTLEDGDLVIGTSGHGIDFSATSGSGTSELLDDYETGTFTPVMSDNVNNGSANSYDKQSGHYTKIGNIVHIIGSLRATDLSNLSSGANLCIRGLPFTVSDVTAGGGEPDFFAITFMNNLTNVSRGLVYGRFENGVAAAQLGYATTTGQFASNLLINQLNSGGNTFFSFSGTYRTGS